MLAIVKLLKEEIRILDNNSRDALGRSLQWFNEAFVNIID